MTTIHRPKLAIGITQCFALNVVVRVPDGFLVEIEAMFFAMQKCAKLIYVGRTFQEPQKFGNYRFPCQFLRRYSRETVQKVEFDLFTEDSQSTDLGTINDFFTFVKNFAIKLV
ncbi:hypothetical protein D3C81_1670790 [compost metagenome]